MAQNYEIDKIFANPNAQVIIALPSAVRLLNRSGSRKLTNNRNAVVGFMTNQLSLGGNAEYNNLFGSSSQDSANDFLDKVRAGGDFVKNLSLRTVAQSLANWSSSSKPQLNIEMILIATRPEDDVREDVKTLLRTVYPETQGSGFKTVYTAPLGYLPTRNTELRNPTRLAPQGTIAVKIGQWFKATQQIMKNVDHTFSNQVHSNGTPLYATVTFTFEPYKLPSASEVGQYISG